MTKESQIKDLKPGDLVVSGGYVQEVISTNYQPILGVPWVHVTLGAPNNFMEPGYSLWISGNPNRVVHTINKEKSDAE